MSKAIRQSKGRKIFRATAVFALVLAAVASASCARAQDAPAQSAGGRQRGQFAGGGQFAGMPRVGGEVTAVSGPTITVKTEDGAVMQIVTTDNTRIMKGRPNEGGGAVKASDLKVGDGVMAIGNLDAPNKTLHAAMVMATDAAQMKALKDNLGKTYILGKVTAIDMDNAKMTIARQDGVSQVIGLDETTSFRRGRVNPNGMGGGFGGQRGGGNGAPTADANAESITLADVKVGDMVAGRGALKGGTFVPTQLTIGTPGQRRARLGNAAAGVQEQPPQ
jgi:hypothetical protein